MMGYNEPCDESLFVLVFPKSAILNFTRRWLVIQMGAENPIIQV
jgi:hypothetical protein